MFSYEMPANDFEENIKPAVILGTIKDICADILKYGENTSYPRSFQNLYDYIEENLDTFLDKETI